MSKAFRKKFKLKHGEPNYGLHWTQVRKLVAQGHIIATPAKTKAKRITGAFPSSPGDPPHKQTGTLLKSVAYELVPVGNKIIARVGTNIKYGRYLELGTRKIKPRPWLRRALIEQTNQIQAILKSPINLDR
jgi:hypothetical protein